MRRVFLAFQSTKSFSREIKAGTIEPQNRGHFGTAAFVLSSELVLFSEVV